ncbi:hypothetical protein HYH03_010034 [Edaphochlamys debaryana]|uniref:Uncharacterized protein n=1 Tax=Edaphochlamys debaryana TaxID=47281 RepID=A0A836BWM7_9CHLO|nr:hypothetical protein HYH03_010034 [Edaphochlamys debaryana]|eukprot:KAG2491665.1 hypothetical protein HYH03_010034 [Edaphochlamys debaryana]
MAQAQPPFVWSDEERELLIAAAYDLYMNGRADALIAFLPKLRAISPNPTPLLLLPYIRVIYPWQAHLAARESGREVLPSSVPAADRPALLAELALLSIKMDRLNRLPASDWDSTVLRDRIASVQARVQALRDRWLAEHA